MGRHLFFSVFILVMLNGFVSPLKGQEEKADTNAAFVLKNVIPAFKNFKINFYIDAYFVQPINDAGDTSRLSDFASNCKFMEQIRLNVASIMINYNTRNARSKLYFQYGDSPNLLASASEQWVKFIRQANFGFRVVKNFWIDAGYFLNPIGMESTFPIFSPFSNVSVGGYYEPSSVLAVKLSAWLKKKFYFGILGGNPYTLAYGKNTRGWLFYQFSYKPNQKFSVNYNGMYGNSSLTTQEVDRWTAYNNVYVDYSPIENLQLLGQVDFGFQTNATRRPDTTGTAGMISGFAAAKARLASWFSVGVRLEWYNDPHGIFSPVYHYADTYRGLWLWGTTISAEFRPVTGSAVRCEYRFIKGKDDNNVFYGNTADRMGTITITAGLLF